MRHYPDPKPCYETSAGKVSIHDLLHSFADADLHVDGISRVSDLHLKNHEPVRFRVDGSLENIEGGVPLNAETLRNLVAPLVSTEVYKSVEDGDAEDFDLGYFWEEQGINFRVNLFSDRDGVACVIRMLPRHVPELSTLGFLKKEVIPKLTTIRQGLILVTGVTSSGKSTTVASILNELNQRRRFRVITLEDPIEFVFKSDQCLISQRELGTHIRTFAQGLRSALRENPDVIYVGEIRDPDTAALALSAAETGHLVLSTLHTKDVKGTFSRLVDMFPSDRSDEVAAQLSFSTSVVISQKLAQRKDGPGRIPAFEVLINDNATGNLIRTGKWHQLYGKIETGGRSGMNTLEQHLIHLYEAGEIDRDEAIHMANDIAIAERLG